MSWHFLQEQEAAFWEGSSSDGAPSALSRLMPTVGASSSPVSETASSQPSPSGTTCEPSTGGPGAAPSISSPGASPARTSPAPARGQASTARSLDSGANSPGSFSKWDRATSSWRTAQCSLFGGLSEFSETWPRWGSMRSGACWEQPTLAHRTVESGCGSWQTPSVEDASRAGSASAWSEWTETGRTTCCRLRNQVAACPTPSANDWKGSSKPGQRRGQLTDPAVGLIPAGGHLNPTWVEWLMGWPLGWTDCAPLATDRFQLWLRSHGAPSRQVAA